MREMPSELPGSGEPRGAADPADSPGRAEPWAPPAAGPAHGVAEPGRAPGAAGAPGADPRDSPGSADRPGAEPGPRDRAVPEGEPGPPGGGHAPEEDTREIDELGQAMLTGATYGVLFVLGAFLGVLGAMEHSWILVNVPVAAIGWLAVLFAVPYGMGRMMGSRVGALITAVGWGVISAVFAGRRSEGDLLIAGNAAGYAYLYGGMVMVAVAVLLVPSSGSWLLTPRFGEPPPADPQGLPR